MKCKILDLVEGKINEWLAENESIYINKIIYVNNPEAIVIFYDTQ